MSGCCCTKNEPTKSIKEFGCPKCGDAGKLMNIITLKSLLLPSALTRLEPDNTHYICNNPECSIAYFNEAGNTFLIADLKVLVYPKSSEEDCPVCYCFGWTRKKIKAEAEQTGTSSAVISISEHIKAGRCGCEVNNPQGSCCLGNVKSYLASIQ